MWCIVFQIFVFDYRVIGGEEVGLFLSRVGHFFFILGGGGGWAEMEISMEGGGGRLIFK